MIEKQKDFLSIQNFSAESLLKLIDTALDMKKDKDKYSDSLKNKKLGMIFEKSSTRTRISFETGIYELGGTGLFLSKNDIQMGRGETIEDTAKVLSRYLDGMMIRTFHQDTASKLADSADIPVINGLTDLYHPCQALSDMMTVLEYKKKLKDLNFTYIGDANNMANSLGIITAKLGINFSIAYPEEYPFDPDVKKLIQQNAEISGSKTFFTHDPVKACENADILYTDVWISMGQENNKNNPADIFRPYQINSQNASKAEPDYIFMHCLPAHRGEEVTEEIIDGPASVIFDQAENRLHAQKAVMHYLMGDKSI